MPASLLAGFLLAARLAEPEGELVDPGEGAPAVGEVEVSGALWRSLQPEPEPVPGAMILRREVVLRRVEGGVELRAKWLLRSERAEWFANGLLGPDVHLRRARWNGRPATVWSGEQGPLVVERIDGAATLEVEAFVPGDASASAGVVLPLLGAPRGTVTLDGFPAEVALAGGEQPVVPHGRRGALSTGASELRLRVAPSEPRDRGPLVVGSVGLGVTVGDAEVRGRARVRFEIRQGTRSSLSLSVRGVGEDLTVEGPQVSRWERSGEQLAVELTGETTGLVDLDLRWTVATPRGAEAKVPLPVIVPLEVFRSPAAVQVARDGEVDVRPALGAGWRPLASAQVPAWAEGLVEGTPTAAFVRARPAESGGDALELLRLEPVPGPPVVVDVADLRIAASEQGRLVARVRYEVRNERASHLAFTPPPGMRVVGVEVAGRRVTPGRDGDGGALRIPLKRSLETVSGSVTVPVTVALLGAGDDDGEAAWARRERRELALPVVDAPVNVTRVTLHLPPRWRSRLRPGDGPVVEAFDRGQEVAFGLEDVHRVAAADRVFAEAVEAWNANEFERAQERLDALRSLGAAGANADGLQANVDLVRPRAAEAVAPTTRVTAGQTYDFDDEVGIDELDAMGSLEGEPIAEMPAPAPAQSSAVERRIKARARARAGSKKVQLQGRKEKAKQLKAEGQYEAAAAEYRQAIEESKALDRLEDEESVEYDFEAEALMGELQEVEARTESRDSASSDAVQDAASEESAEKDMVSGGLAGLWRVLVQDEGALAAEPVVSSVGSPQVDADAGPWGMGPLVAVPEIGEAVRYQHLLLEAGERRTVPVDARRRLWR